MKKVLFFVAFFVPIFCLGQIDSLKKTISPTGEKSISFIIKRYTTPANKIIEFTYFLAFNDSNTLEGPKNSKDQYIKLAAGQMEKKVSYTIPVEFASYPCITLFAWSARKQENNFNVEEAHAIPVK